MYRDILASVEVRNTNIMETTMSFSNKEAKRSHPFQNSKYEVFLLLKKLEFCTSQIHQKPAKKTPGHKDLAAFLNPFPLIILRRLFTLGGNTQ